MTDINPADGLEFLRVLKAMVEKGLLTREQVLSTVKPKGRAAPPLPEFTFPDSGVTVSIRKMGPFTLDLVRTSLLEKHQPPSPPMVEVNYGTEDKPEMKLEANPADPAYKEQLAAYEVEIAEKSGREVIEAIIENAVVVDVDLEEVKSARVMLERLGTDPEEVVRMSDHAVYVKHVCIKSSKDLTQLQEVVLGESIPSEAAVRRHEDTFRGEVSREAATPVQSADVRNEIQYHP